MEPKVELPAWLSEQHAADIRAILIGLEDEGYFHLDTDEEQSLETIKSLLRFPGRYVCFVEPQLEDLLLYQLDYSGFKCCLRMFPACPEFLDLVGANSEVCWQAAGFSFGPYGQNTVSLTEFSDLNARIAHDDYDDH